MARVVSHFTSANSCIEWLAHEPPNLDRARAATARIDKYGNRAAEIIYRIRSFYKKSPPQRELVDVNGVIQEMLTLLKGEATRYPIAMRAELTTDLPKIMADRVQLQQVFMNLMLNAIEAMKDPGGELTVKSQLQDGRLQFSWLPIVGDHHSSNEVAPFETLSRGFAPSPAKSNLRRTLPTGSSSDGQSCILAVSEDLPEYPQRESELKAPLEKLLLSIWRVVGPGC
jgi:signal transduction histidine kinase